ncbi:protein PLASTID MOVEMENT IMPAIRED 2-like [Bidens hawaiensis]|uniref:protein PLASTID MOVEMENT IMPAIRED 2-like n=1 Tax=Bidens hawaiensis TaxID=980011 RepID=UPI00404AAA9D
MTSMDVIRNELKRIRDEKSPFEKEEAKRDLMIETLNTKILKEQAKLESITATTEKANSVASNLSVTVENLRREAETIKKQKELIIKETENIKLEIPKTETEIELTEERLEAVMEELKTTKSTEFTALENLKTVIDSTVRAREQTSLNSPTIIITTFEYEYLTGKASGAEEIADKKVVAAQAWVEALKANEKEIIMKIEMSKKEIRELDAKWGQNEEKVLASLRRSMYKIGSMTPGRRTRSQKLLSPATRHAIRSASFGKRKEKGPRNMAKSLDENDEMGE